MASNYEQRRAELKNIATQTLAALSNGSYTLNGKQFILSGKTELAKKRTLYYPPDALSSWTSFPSIPTQAPAPGTQIYILEISTLDAARFLATQCRVDPTNHAKIGILNFASADKPGGGFLNGAQAQEESIARSSTLYPTLTTSTAQAFYTLHRRDAKGGYYSHAMIFSPDVVVFRDDGGGWTVPLEVDVVTSPAVNAGAARKTLFGKVGGQAEEARIEKTMRERMGRILFLFEEQGIRDIVLGSFGTGVFKNEVSVVAQIWANLLSVSGARFRHSFDRVVFGVLGDKTYSEFKHVFKKQK